MTRRTNNKRRAAHTHRAVVAHSLRQQSGIPYEVELKVCSDCRTVLDERTVKRAVA